MNIASINGFHWQLPEQDERIILAMTQQDIPEIVARLLQSRGVTLDQVEKHLNPKLRDFLPDPFHLKDMEIAAEKLAIAVINQNKIVIFGDYDVDGATSSALLKKFFSSVGLEVSIYIPDRIKEGYGPNPEAMKLLRSQGAEIIITVDCGTMATDALQVAVECGLEIIVVDHHQSSTTLPPALAIINPNRLDETSEYGYLAAVGVSFLLAIAVKSKLKELAWFKTRDEPDLLNLLDLVALGTICDVVPLIGLNRALVMQGLKVLASRKNVGLSALFDVADISDYPNTYHLGYVLGPRINAGGRIGKSSLGAELLTSTDYDHAQNIAKQLDVFNQERKVIEENILDDAIKLAETKLSEAPLLFISKNNWHPGVIGIIASRIKDLFNKPTAIISMQDGVGKASCRSLKGVDFGAAIIAASIEGLVIAGGGHAMAAGFTVAEEKLTELEAFLQMRFQNEMMQNRHSHNQRFFDGHLTTNAITFDLAKQLERVGPYGAGNRTPSFMLRQCFIVKSEIMARQHLRLIITSDKNSLSATIMAICFKCVDTKLGDKLLSHQHQPVDVIGQIKVNNWQGMQKAQFIIEDIIIT